MSLIWLDGRLLPAADATVPVAGNDFTRGDGCFETLRTHGGVPFAVTRHLRRIRAGLAVLGITIEWTDDDLARALADVAATVEGTGEARIRLTVTRTTTFVTATPLVPRPPTGSCVVVPWRRNEHSSLTGLKTISYAENVIALAEAERLGFDEALFANTAGDLCEGTATNVFVVLDGELLTPPLASGCLAGVTRDLVLEVTGAVERTLPVAALDEASEVLLTSTTRDVQGQHRVGDRRLAAPGPVTTEARAAFAVLLTRTVDP